MVKLMGHTVHDKTDPDGDIAIQYIGLRPAEKLYDELLIGSNVSGTEHPRIMRADETFVPFDTLWELIRDLQAAAAGLDYTRARNLLTQVVTEYRPTDGIDDLVWLSKNGGDVRQETDSVIPFPGKKG